MFVIKIFESVPNFECVPILFFKGKQIKKIKLLLYIYIYFFFFFRLGCSWIERGVATTPEGMSSYEAWVCFRIRVRVRVQVRDSAIFEKIGCGCGD